MSTDRPDRRTGFALPGCLITFLVWLLAAYIAVGMQLGDCVPTADHACPTDHDRLLQLVWVGIGAIILNLLLLVVLAVARRKKWD